MSSPPVRFHLGSFLLGGLLVGLAAGLVFLLNRAPQPPPIVLHPPPTPAPTATSLPTPTPPPIVVYVSGAVMHPGLYSAPPDARVGDVVQMAGGFADHAAGDTLNLAERVWDGARVHVGSQPSPHSLIPQTDVSASTSEMTLDMSADETERVADVSGPPTGLSGSLLPPPVSDTTLTSGASSTNAAGAAPINLNTASQAELETLPGIGPTRAQAIIANRPYGRVEEITRVSGIGDGILAQIRDLVVVE